LKDSAATVAGLRTAISLRFPKLAAFIEESHARFAVDQDYADEESTEIKATSEVAVIPPVSGG
jgi:molybdopterin converting factor small subunit